jgi:hypothetical protein
MSDFRNDIRCIYHILASRVLSVISHTMITIEKECCLYAMLTKTPIDYCSVVTSTTMFISLLDRGFALPYGALITRIAVHFGVNMTRLREVQPEKGAMGVRFLNISQVHLREAEQEQRAQRQRRTTQAGGAPARLKELMDRFEASLQET